MAYYCIYRFSHQQSPHCPIPSRWFHTDFAKRTPPWPKKWGKSASFRPKKNIAGIPNMGCWSKPLIIPFLYPHVSPPTNRHRFPLRSPHWVGWVNRRWHGIPDASMAINTAALKGNISAAALTRIFAVAKEEWHHEAWSSSINMCVYTCIYIYIHTLCVYIYIWFYLIYIYIYNVHMYIFNYIYKYVCMSRRQNQLFTPGAKICLLSIFGGGALSSLSSVLFKSTLTGWWLGHPSEKY